MRMLNTIGLLCAMAAIPATQAQTVAEPAVKKVFKSTKSIPSEIKYVFNRDLGAGRIKRGTDGHDGQIITVTTRYYYHGKVIREICETQTKPAKPTTIEISPKGFQGASRGSFTRSRVVTMESTAYLPSDGVSSRGPFLTRTGRTTQYGVIAVDPRIIPLNTLVYVEGYGFAIAADTGGAIKGNRIDVCVMDRRTMDAWGRRKVTVHIFQGLHQDSGRKSKKS